MEEQTGWGEVGMRVGGNKKKVICRLSNTARLTRAATLIATSKQQQFWQRHTAYCGGRTGAGPMPEASGGT